MSSLSNDVKSNNNKPSDIKSNDIVYYASELCKEDFCILKFDETSYEITYSLLRDRVRQVVRDKYLLEHKIPYAKFLHIYFMFDAKEKRIYITPQFIGNMDVFANSSDPKSVITKILGWVDSKIIPLIREGSSTRNEQIFAAIQNFSEKNKVHYQGPFILMIKDRTHTFLQTHFAFPNTQITTKYNYGTKIMPIIQNTKRQIFMSDKKVEPTDSSANIEDIFDLTDDAFQQLTKNTSKKQLDVAAQNDDTVIVIT
jgi:hypothetical protein